jgi:CAAD domains of cyanobacterial aminoacyl-tRNA synthetase
LKQSLPRTDMNPEIVNNYTEEPEIREREVEVEVNNEVEVSNTEAKLLPPQKLSTEFPSAPNNAEWQKYGEKIGQFLQDLPRYISRFFTENKSPLAVIGLIFAALIAVKLTLAILDAINDIPLIAPTFELIGFGYTAWFVYRYLLRATNRRELSSEIQSLKQQIFGVKS